MKVLLDWDPLTGNLMHGTYFIGVCNGLTEHKEPELPQVVESNNIDAMVKLKNSGFTAKEVIEISKAGLL